VDLDVKAQFEGTYNPFSPDIPLIIPYETKSLRETLKVLHFFLHLGEGIAILIGEDGIGKTTILQRFAETLTDGYLAIPLSGFYEGEREFFKGILEKVGWKDTQFREGDLREVIRETVIRLFEEKREIVLLIDDAEKLKYRNVLLLQYLSSIKFTLFRPFRIVLFGNLLFFNELTKKTMREFVKNISVIHFVKPISLGEVPYYVNHRLNLSSSIFPEISRKAISLVLSYSGGNPSKLNAILEKALFLAKERSLNIINEKIIEEVASPLIKSGTRKKERLQLILLFLLCFSLFYIIWTITESPLGIFKLIRKILEVMAI
jgi:type II secretory pathway predicted ATPase ExeA